MKSVTTRFGTFGVQGLVERYGGGAVRAAMPCAGTVIATAHGVFTPAHASQDERTKTGPSLGVFPDGGLPSTVPEARPPKTESCAFAWEVGRGAWAHQREIDEVVVRFSKNWKLTRIAKVELTILRLAMHEILYRQDIPLRVAINEAVELAKAYGDDNSPTFVNGILDAVARAVDNGEFTIRKGL